MSNYVEGINIIAKTRNNVSRLAVGIGIELPKF